MVFTPLQPSKTLPKLQITDDIKGSEVEPADDINLSLTRTFDLLIESLDEEITVAQNDGFLFSERAV